MRNTEQDNADLMKLIRRQARKAQCLGLLWKVLALPVVLALSGFLVSGGNSRLFSIEERLHIFLYLVPVWVLLYAVLAFHMESLRQSQTALILENMRLLRYHPSGGDRADGYDIFEFGPVMSYLLNHDVNYKWPPPPLLRAAMIEYYRSCGRQRKLPYLRTPLLVEFTCAVTVLGILLAGFGLIFTGIVEGGHGFDGPGIVASQLILFAIFAIYYCSITRKHALLLALRAALNQSQKRVDLQKK